MNGSISSDYRRLSVPVEGGDLAVGCWGPEDGPVGSLMRLPMDVEFGDTLTPVGEDEIAAITLGEVRPRTPARA